MKRMFTLLFLFGFLGSSLLLADTAEDIFQQYRGKICRVQFYKNVSSQAQIGSYIKIEQHRIGVIVSADGLVMVNSDVYPLSLDILSSENSSFFSGEPSDFKVILQDGSEYTAEFLGKDDLAQAAFIRITASLKGPLPYVQFNPDISAQVGQRIYFLELLGENYDFQPLFSEYTINAIISKPRQKYLVKDGDVALSAGGLAISAGGDALGVSLRRSVEESFHEGMDFDSFGKNFLEIAPANWLVSLIANPPVLEKALYRGKAWFGIGMQALTPDLIKFWRVPASGGVIVDRVYPDSPAEKAGLQLKDIILSLGGQPVDVQRDEVLGRFREMVIRQPLDKAVPLVIFRDGRRIDKTVTFTSAPRAVDLADKYQLTRLGLEVRELTRDVLYEYNLPLDTHGVYIFQVDRAAPAGLGGLESGSIITAVNGKPVRDLGDFRQKMEKFLADSTARMMFQSQYRRETRFMFVEVE